MTALFDEEEERAVKRVLLCRHGQGYHNVDGPHLFDPELTDQGIDEAKAVFASASDFVPELVLVSPLWRTLQTATLALSARPDGHTCPMLAMEELREHNNRSACNHRRAVQAAHSHTFPAVDFSGIDAEGPESGSEFRHIYKEAFGVLRARAAGALRAIAARPEERIAAFCHGTYIRALLSEVLRLSPHHAAKAPGTGGVVEILLIETPGGELYWELVSDLEHGHEVMRLSRVSDPRRQAARRRDASPPFATAPASARC